MTTGSPFDIDLDQCIGLVEDYRNRKFDDDLTTIKQKFDGIEGLSARLRTDINDGLKGDDFEMRDETFGSNQKEKAKRTGL